eukprot:scaffold47_cov258-Pinguiococcus_pyrenoidosus.AAC.80
MNCEPTLPTGVFCRRPGAENIEAARPDFRQNGKVNARGYGNDPKPRRVTVRLCSRTRMLESKLNPQQRLFLKCLFTAFLSPESILWPGRTLRPRRPCPAELTLSINVLNDRHVGSITYQRTGIQCKPFLARPWWLLPASKTTRLVLTFPSIGQLHDARVASLALLVPRTQHEEELFYRHLLANDAHDISPIRVRICGTTVRETCVQALSLATQQQKPAPSLHFVTSLSASGCTLFAFGKVVRMRSCLIREVTMLLQWNRVSPAARRISAAHKSAPKHGLEVRRRSSQHHLSPERVGQQQTVGGASSTLYTSAAQRSTAQHNAGRGHLLLAFGLCPELGGASHATRCALQVSSKTGRQDALQNPPSRGAGAAFLQSSMSKAAAIRGSLQGVTPARQLYRDICKNIGRVLTIYDLNITTADNVLNTLELAFGGQRREVSSPTAFGRKRTSKIRASSMVRRLFGGTSCGIQLLMLFAFLCSVGSKGLHGPGRDSSSAQAAEPSYADPEPRRGQDPPWGAQGVRPGYGADPPIHRRSENGRFQLGMDQKRLLQALEVKWMHKSPFIAGNGVC